MSANFNKNAFSSMHDKKYRNWDGYSLIYTFDFIKSIENLIDLNNIQVIFDIGSRDACQTLEMSDWFPNSKIYCFEPVPQNAVWCKKNIASRQNIFFEEAAISEIDGDVDFFVVTNGNIGASSLLNTNKNHFYGNTYKQEQIKIKSTKAVSYIKNNKIQNVDLIWMDVQGAELTVLKSFENEIKNVKAIHTEAALSSVYDKASMKGDIIHFLEKNEFKLIKCLKNDLGIEEDLIFVNTRFQQ